MDNELSPITVLVVDDQKLLRQSLSLIIATDSEVSVVGQASNGIEAVAMARELHPDIVLMDIRMPGGDGITATREIAKIPGLTNCKILVMTMFDLDEHVYEALRAGASGFLLKDVSPEQLISAIKRTHAGESIFAPSVLQRLIEHYTSVPGTRRFPELKSRRETSTYPVSLTPRELEILALIGKGLSNQEISTNLFISIKTVKTHIGNLLAKLHARDRAQLVIAAYEQGLVGR